MAIIMPVVWRSPGDYEDGPVGLEHLTLSSFGPALCGYEPPLPVSVVVIRNRPRCSLCQAVDEKRRTGDGTSTESGS